MSPIHASSGSLPLIALRAFEAAARRQSFRDGAAEVGLTPSAVSHHVRHLEASLGVPLFERQHRAVVPTRPGTALAAAMGDALAAIARAYAAAQAPTGTLLVSATPGFAGRWLLPVIQPLREEGIDLQVEATSAPVDIEGGACHVAIRLAPRAPPRVAATRLAMSPVVLVAAPSRVAGRAALDPQEIGAGPLLGLSIGPAFWPEALRVIGASPAAHAEVRFDSFDAALQAAEAGHGIAFAPEILVADRIARGVLTLAHPRRFGRRSAWSYWFLTRPEITDRLPVRRLLALLQSALAAA